MELPSTSGAGGGGGPAPFLIKTYDMVDDSSTDEIVSWSPSKASFIVWNPPEFARLLLPTYFKHNNFSSFIRQLNTYGFRKIDPERWEFANEDFVKDKKHLLKNIHRRKPIHSHSHPPPDPERLTYEEEIEKLTREKNELDAKVSGFAMQRSVTKSQLEEITKRIGSIEQRQEKLLACFHKAVQSPAFVEQLVQKIESMDLSAYSKKRRLPQVNHQQPAAENNLGDDQSSCRLEIESFHQQDLSNKLKLELSTAVSNINLVSNSTQSSSDDWASPPSKSSDAIMKDAEMGISTLPFATETAELLETEACLAFKMDSSLSDKVGSKECPALQSLQQSIVPAEECEGHISCQLNLSLASSQMPVNHDSYLDKATHMDVEAGGSAGTRRDENENRDGIELASKNNLSTGNTGNLSQEAPSNNKAPAPAAPARVNDQFWEQFLTERPGSSDTEEACSSYRALPCDDQEDRGSSHSMSRSAKNFGKLSL